VIRYLEIEPTINAESCSCHKEIMRHIFTLSYSKT
jgi:hypothetical protein